MKKILIIVGVILLLILGGVWAYISIYGVPKSTDEIFGRFTTAPDAPRGPGDVDTTTIDTESGNEEATQGRLYQLTTRPVAGATFVDTTVRYVERGTGHVYEIALQGGNERMVSGTTVPRTVRAIFSPSGDRIALITERAQSLVTMLGTLVKTGSEARLEMTALPDGAREAGFSTKGDVLNFFVPNVEGGSGYAYTLESKKTTELFSTPLRDVRVLWGSPTYLYTTPSAYAMGYVYSVGSSGLSYVTKGSKGLMAFSYASGTLVSSLANNEITTTDTRYGAVPILRLFPEKCGGVSSQARIVYCASPLIFDATRVYPDDWYKGTVSFSDAILRIDAPSSTVDVVSYLEEESGRPIDVSALGANTLGNLVYFINKFDNTLWLLDLR